MSAAPRLQRLSVTPAKLDAPDDPDPLGAGRATWADPAVRLHLIRDLARHRSIVRIAVGSSGVAVAGVASERDAAAVPVGIHPDPGALGRLVAEVMGIARSGPPPAPLPGALPIVELKRLLAGSMALESHWVRVGSEGTWRDALGAVTAPGCGWALVDAMGRDLLVVRPSDARSVWRRLCRLTDLVVTTVGPGDRPATATARRE